MSDKIRVDLAPEQLQAVIPLVAERVTATDERDTPLEQAERILDLALLEWERRTDDELSEARHEIKRLRSAAARALERVQVEDCGEAEMILSQVVNLDASPVGPSSEGTG